MQWLITITIQKKKKTFSDHMTKRLGIKPLIGEQKSTSQ